MKNQFFNAQQCSIQKSRRFIRHAVISLKNEGKKFSYVQSSTKLEVSILPNGQSSPGSLQAGQQPSKAIRHILPNGRPCDISYPMGGHVTHLTQWEAMWHILPNGQSSPGSLQSGQQPSKAIRHILPNGRPCDISYPMGGHVTYLTQWEAMWHILPNGQSSPGSLQSGQQPSKAIRHIPTVFIICNPSPCGHSRPTEI